jgi:hypothetical protein
MNTAIFVRQEGEAIDAGIVIRGRDGRFLHHELTWDCCRYGGATAERNNGFDQSPG